MADPAIIAAGIGAGASLAGGFLGNRASQDASKDAWDRQKKLIKHGPKWMVKAAERAGLHPLTVLGMQPHQGPMARPTGDYGMEAAGQAISRSLARIQTAEELANNEAQRQLLKAQKNYYQAMADREINAMKPGDPDPVFGFGGVMPGQGSANAFKNAFKVEPKPAAISQGVQGPVGAFYDSHVDPAGYVWLTPNQNVQDAVTEGLYDQTRYMLSRLKFHFDTAVKDPEAVKVLARLKQDILRQQPIPRGYDLQWSRLRGQFKVVKLARDQETSLFMNPKYPKEGRVYKEAPFWRKPTIVRKKVPRW